MMDATLIRQDGVTTAAASDDAAREVVELGRAEAMRLLAGVTYGRVVLSLDALPAIRVVNHLVDGGRIILRTRLTAKTPDALRPHGDSGLVVAYEADDLDSDRRAGWTVVVTGMANPITDPDEAARYERLLRPWVNEADTVVAIEPQIVTGIRVKPVGATL
jgi:hypothetical protein